MTTSLQPVHHRSARPRGPAQVREAVLDVAGELFAERGPATVTVRDIADRAGVNHALVHRYFGTKRDVLAAWMRREGEAFAAALDAGPSLRDHLPDVIALAAERRGFVRVVALSEIEGELFTGIGQEFPFVERLVAGLRAELVARPAPAGSLRPEVAAIAVHALAIGFVALEGFLRTAADLAGERDDEVLAAVGAVMQHVWDAARRPGPTAQERAAAQPPPVRAPGPAVKPRGPAEVRAATLVAAGELLGGPGAGGVTVRDIAERAGVNHALVHRYFGTKDQLLDAVLLQGSRAAAELIDPRRPARAQLPAVLAGVTRERSYVNLVVMEELGSSSVAERQRGEFPVVTRLRERIAVELAERPAGRGALDPRVVVACVVAIGITWSVLGEFSIRAAALAGVTPDDLLPDIGCVIAGVWDAAWGDSPAR